MCADAAELAAWGARLTDLGIEGSGGRSAPVVSHLNVRDLDAIPMEFFRPRASG